MKKRKVALLAATAAVPLVVGQLHAQPRLRDRNPAAAGALAQTSPGDDSASGGSSTGSGSSTKTTTTTTVGPSGKAQADTSGLSQFESGIEFEPRSPNYKVAFSLEDADLNELVRVISQLTGKRFIFGGKVKNIKASVYSPQKVTVAEAYQAFLSILEANKLTVVPHGRFLKIVDTDAIATTGTPIYGTHQGAPAEDRYVTRMHRLAHISADDAAAVLGKFKSKEADITVYGPGNMIIITDTGSNIRRMMSILEEIDVGSSGDQIFIEPIHYASASEVEKKLNDLFDVRSGSSAPSAPKAAGGSTTSAAPAASDLHVTKVVADDRSNSLIIVATERAYLRMLELIKRIDVPQTGEGEIHVLSLQHADATELTKTLNDIISGAGTAGTPATPGGPRGQTAAASSPGAPPSGIFEGGIKVSADKATNSLVITSSLRDFVSLQRVIERLDQPRRQVFIEAVIMDLQLKRSNTLGVSFHGGAPFETQAPDDSVVYGGNKIMNTILPVPTDPEALQGFALGVRGPGISGSQNFLGTGISIPAFGTFIQAIAKTGDTDLLSTPHILALDNEDAEINVGDNVPLQTNQGIGSLAGLAGAVPGAAGATGALGALGGLGGLGFGAFGVPRQDVGTKIKIKPHLNDSNEVRLDVTEEISEVGANVGGTSGAFNISKRTATTKLVVQDQQTIVIGGLIRNVVGRSEEKVPVLGDIPVLGALFRKRTNQNEKRNLILILTPYIIRSQQDLRTVFERKMQERQEYLDRYFVFSDASEYNPPKDWSRANGLLEDIRQSYLKLEERRRLEEIARPKTLKTHEPQSPLEMPQNLRPAGGGATTPDAPTNPTPATPAPASPAPGGATTPPVNVNPAVRNIERIER
mgnify:CR=1 FL=1